MRVGVLDLGSHSVHLDVTELVAGGPPEVIATFKRQVRLARATDRDGVIDETGIRRAVRAVAECTAVLDEYKADELIPFATAAVRDAANREAVVRAIETATGIRLGFLSGEEEARLTYLAARRWYGWSAGQLLLLDIGGGSLEIAWGAQDEPDVALSVPLGAGLLTRHHLPEAPPVKKGDVKALRRHVRSVIREALASVPDMGGEVTNVATSKTFTQLARLAGTDAPGPGPHPSRTLRHEDLLPWVPRLADRTNSQRARLRGISATRAHQSLAGAVVADVVMETLGIARLTICPWALREGILLERLDTLPVPHRPHSWTPTREWERSDRTPGQG